MHQDYASAGRPPLGRGATILTLGILSIVLSGCAPAGVILGILAWSKAKEDLPRIQSGRIREEEWGLTKAGHICGIVGMCLSGLMLLVLVFQMVLFVLMLVLGGGGAMP